MAIYLLLIFSVAWMVAAFKVGEKRGAAAGYKVGVVDTETRKVTHVETLQESMIPPHWYLFEYSADGRGLGLEISAKYRLGRERFNGGELYDLRSILSGERVYRQDRETRGLPEPVAVVVAPINPQLRKFNIDLRDE